MFYSFNGGSQVQVMSEESDEDKYVSSDSGTLTQDINWARYLKREYAKDVYNNKEFHPILELCQRDVSHSSPEWNKFIAFEPFVIQMRHGLSNGISIFFVEETEKVLYIFN